MRFTTAAVGLKPLTPVRGKTKDAPDKGDLVTSEVKASDILSLLYVD